MGTGLSRPDALSEDGGLGLEHSSVGAAAALPQPFPEYSSLFQDKEL